MDDKTIQSLRDAIAACGVLGLAAWEMDSQSWHVFAGLFSIGCVAFGWIYNFVVLHDKRR